MPGVDGINMVEEHDHLMNHRLGEEDMNMVEEHYHMMNHWLEVDIHMDDMDMVEVEGMNMVVEHPSNHQSKVEDIDREDSDMGDDMTIEVEVVEREHESVVFMRHWSDDGAERYRPSCREWEELAKSGCSKGYTTFASRDSNYSTWHRV
jgi:hypothetical protein